MELKQSYDFLGVNISPNKQYEKKKHTRGPMRAKRAHVAQSPLQAAPPMLVGTSSVWCHPSWSKIDGLALKNAI
jgi:hypothetical protein